MFGTATDCLILSDSSNQTLTLALLLQLATAACEAVSVKIQCLMSCRGYGGIVWGENVLGVPLKQLRELQLFWQIKCWGFRVVSVFFPPRAWTSSIAGS